MRGNNDGACPDTVIFYAHGVDFSSRNEYITGEPGKQTGINDAPINLCGIRARRAQS